MARRPDWRRVPFGNNYAGRNNGGFGRCVRTSDVFAARHFFDGERSLSNTNTSNLDHGTLEDHRPLADSELDAVTGGYVPTSVDVGNLKLTIGSADFRPCG
jgi:hypothetical protein